jgi:hypothetical protein
MQSSLKEQDEKKKKTAAAVVYPPRCSSRHRATATKNVIEVSCTRRRL